MQCKLEGAESVERNIVELMMDAVIGLYMWHIYLFVLAVINLMIMSISMTLMKSQKLVKFEF